MTTAQRYEYPSRFFTKRKWHGYNYGGDVSASGIDGGHAPALSIHIESETPPASKHVFRSKIPGIIYVVTERNCVGINLNKGTMWTRKTLPYDWEKDAEDRVAIGTKIIFEVMA